MILGLYTVVFSLLLAGAVPAGLVLALFGRRYLYERIFPRNIEAPGTARIWIHAASVGEANIAWSLAGELGRRHPETDIVVSTITRTGLDALRSLMEQPGEKRVSAAFLAPFDHPWIVDAFIRRVKPSSFVLVETELWPWLILGMRKRIIPVAVVNGKVSRRAFRHYMWVRRALRPVLDSIGLFCVQTRTFARRLNHMGVDWDALEIIGNVKFDGLPEKAAFSAGDIRRDLGIPPDAVVLTAGSTRPGEEEALLTSYGRLRERYPDLFLIIAPRHLNRVADIEQKCRTAGVDFRKRSDGHEGKNGRRLLILDTMGELIGAYAAGDMAFVGGSLTDYGGHNPLEPAALGVPVIFGSFMEQPGFKELLSEHSACLVHDADELHDAMHDLLEHPEKRRRMGEAGPNVVRRFRGTLSRSVKQMEKHGVV